MVPQIEEGLPARLAVRCWMQMQTLLLLLLLKDASND